MQQLNERVIECDLLVEAKQVSEWLGDIYAWIGVHGMRTLSAEQLRSISLSVHDLILAKEAYERSQLDRQSFEIMLGKVRLAVIYLKEELQAPALAT